MNSPVASFFCHFSHFLCAVFVGVFHKIIVIVFDISKLDSFHGRETIWLGFFPSLLLLLLQKNHHLIYCVYIVQLCNAQSTITSITPSIYSRAFRLWHFEQVKTFQTVFFLLCGKRNGRTTDLNITFPEIELRSPWFPLKYYYIKCEVFVGNLLKLVISTPRRSCVFL